MLQSEYDKEQRHNRLKILLIILTTLMVALVLSVALKVGKDYLSQPTETTTGVKDTDTLPKSSPEPTKTEFVDRFPTDFPSDIPIEKDAKFTQSYILDYPGQKQLSIVFPSMKTVKESYALYSDYVKKEGWTVINKDEKDNLSFLYATKEGMEMNVTITESITVPSNITPSDADLSQKEKPTPSAKSQVSVSVLRR